jgi:hypothetical protein
LPELARAVAPETVVSTDRSKKPAAECQHCGFQPVDRSMKTCPNCGKKDPTPGVVSRYAGRTAIGGAILGCLIGAICFSVAHPEDRAAAVIGGGLIGALLGLIVGLAGGLTIGIAAKAAGKR